MRYEAYLGTSDKEIEDFYIGGRQVEELWGGNVLLWKKGNIIKENIADFCGFCKCVLTNGVEALAVDYDRGATDTGCGTYFELFIGEAPYAERLLEINDGEDWRAVCFERYFYAIRYETINYMASEHIIKTFCKYDENGNIVYRYENAGIMPTDQIEELNSLHKHHHYADMLGGFYVIDDTFYLIFPIYSADAPTSDKSDDSMHLLVAYKGGAYMFQKMISGVKFIDVDNREDAIVCKNQFLVNGEMLLTGECTPGPYYSNRPLIAVSESGISRPFSENYSYIGTNGKDIFLTNINDNYDNRKKIYLLSDGKYKLIYNINNANAVADYKIAALAFIGDMMYIAANYGDAGFPDHAVVIEVNLMSPEKGTVIYKLNTPKRKYAWIAIRQLTTKNGKLYIHKEWQKLWTDGDKSMLGIDEIIFSAKKKGGTT